MIEDRIDAGRAGVGAFAHNLHALALGRDDADSRAGAFQLADAIQLFMRLNTPKRGRR